MVKEQRCSCCGDVFGRPESRVDLKTCPQCECRKERIKTDKMIYPRGKWW